MCAGVGVGVGCDSGIRFDARIGAEVEVEVGVEIDIGGPCGERWEASLAWIDERREKVVVLRAWAFSL